MKNKFFISLILFMIIILSQFSNTLCSVCYSIIDTTSSAKAMYTFDAYSGREFFKKNSDEKLPMASTTKIITAITALENYKGSLDEKHIVPNDAVGIEGTSMYLKTGEELSLRELLYGLMLPSGNDAGVAISIIVGKTTDNFINMMEEVANKAGAVNSNFVNPHGLDADGHYTTAKDLALITAYALKNPTFREIVSTKNVIIEESNKYQTRYFRNKVKLLNTVDGCIGVKTGFTDNAGRCIVTASEKNGMEIICVLLNCADMFEESERLLNYCNNNFENIEILKSNEYFTTLPVKSGKENYVRLYNKDGFSYPLSKDEKEKLKIENIYPNSLTAPIDNDDVIGEINIFIDKDLIFSSKICTIDRVEFSKKNDIIKELLENWY